MNDRKKEYRFMKHLAQHPAEPKKGLALFLIGATAVVIFVADMFSKQWAFEELSPRRVIPVINGFFSLRYAENSGVAFGMLREMPETVRVPILAALSIFILVGVIVYCWPLLSRVPYSAICAGGLAGGALGNLFERLTQGYVIDFLDFFLGEHHWPTFNIADIGIVCGLLGIAFAMIRADYLVSKLSSEAAPAGEKIDTLQRKSPRATLKEGGFTLLEVMIALAILSMGLFALVDSQSMSIRTTNTIKYYTIASFLARSKMIDVEEELWEKGFGDFDKDLEGDFEEEGYPNIRWKAEIRKIELNPDLSMLGLGGGEDEQTGGSADGGLGIAPDMGGMLGVGGAAFGGQVQMITEALAEQIRYCRLEVSWNEGSTERSFDVVTHFVNMPLAGQVRPEVMETSAVQQTEQ